MLYTISRQPLPVWGTIDRDGLPGEEEYVAVVYDRRPGRAERSAALCAHYLGLLKGLCEWICQIDLATKTSQCLHSQVGCADMGVRVSLWDTLKLRIDRQVITENRQRMREFFKRALIPGREAPYSEEIAFSLSGESGDALPYRGLVIGLDGDQYLFCGMPQYYMDGEDVASKLLENTLGHIAHTGIAGREAFELRCQTSRGTQRWKSACNLFLIAAVDEFECYSLEECDAIQQAILAVLKR